MDKTIMPSIVAEISANHGHDINIVKETIKKAKEIGCDAVKIQTYTPDTITLDCDNEFFQINTGTIWDGTTLHKLYEEAYLPWEWHKELFEYALVQAGNPECCYMIGDNPLTDYQGGWNAML